MGDYAKFTFNSIDARAARARGRTPEKKRGEYFWSLPSQWGYSRGGGGGGGGGGGARYVRKIFSAPLRPFVQQRERENMDFQSISNFLVQRLGREREKRRIIQGGYFCGEISPFFLCTPLSFSLRIASSFLPSFLIRDNARARFPARPSPSYQKTTMS